jgi:hypothetical protein
MHQKCFLILFSPCDFCLRVLIIMLTLMFFILHWNVHPCRVYCLTLFTPTSSHLLNYVQWKTIIHLSTYIWPLKFYIRRFMCHWFNICMYVSYVDWNVHPCRVYCLAIWGNRIFADGCCPIFNFQCNVVEIVSFSYWSFVLCVRVVCTA